MTVTAMQVRDAAVKAGISKIDHHECGGCKYMTRYLISDDLLFFDPGCDCSRYGRSDPRPAQWQEAADWINMQTKDEHRDRLLKAFGLS